MSKKGNVINVDLMSELYNEINKALVKLDVSSIPTFDGDRRVGKIINGNDTMIQNINAGIKRIIDNVETKPSGLIISVSKPFINNMGELLIANDYENIINWLRTIEETGVKLTSNLDWETDSIEGGAGYMLYVFITVGGTDNPFVSYKNQSFAHNAFVVMYEERKIHCWFFANKDYKDNPPKKVKAKFLDLNLVLNQNLVNFKKEKEINNSNPRWDENNMFEAIGMIAYVSDVLDDNTLNKIRNIKNHQRVPLTLTLI